MKTYLLAAIAAAAIAMPAAARNPYLGKANDYGSIQLAQMNVCMQSGKSDPDGALLAACMEANNFRFLPNARVFGNSGPRCKADSEARFHSWCWGTIPGIEKE
jgi:hypothetical protein